jgi:hypothetical protein
MNELSCQAELHTKKNRWYRSNAMLGAPHPASLAEVLCNIDRLSTWNPRVDLHDSSRSFPDRFSVDPRDFINCLIESRRTFVSLVVRPLSPSQMMRLTKGLGRFTPAQGYVPVSIEFSLGELRDQGKFKGR